MICQQLSTAQYSKTLFSSLKVTFLYRVTTISNFSITAQVFNKPNENPISIPMMKSLTSVSAKYRLI